MQTFLWILFAIGILSLTIDLLLLTVAKRKFNLYLKQISENGEISGEIGTVEATLNPLDLFIAFDIFLPIPTEAEQPQFYEHRLIKKQKKRIEFLNRIAMGSVFLIVVSFIGFLI